MNTPEPTFSPSSTRSCPECSVELPVHDGFATWCHACSWNLVAPEQSRPTGRVDRLYGAAARRLGERLTAELIDAPRLEPRLNSSKAIAYVIALGV